MSNLTKKYYLETLGCAKNEVDSEAIEVSLISAGFAKTDDVGSADLILVNSCGFINDAKIESIDTALYLHMNRKKGSLLVMCGCLPARYNMERIFKEVDLFLPSTNHNQLVPYLNKIGWTKKTGEDSEKRVRPRYPYGYLKLSDGCDNRCSYCAIPDIKGVFYSRSFDEIVSEAEYLCQNFVKELVLIGQDTTMFGLDRNDKSELPKLVNRLVRIEGLKWLRIMYAHPAHLTDEIIEVVASKDKLLKYIDLPIQHISDEILKKMNRKIDGKGIMNLIARLRASIPEIVLRTTFIVGFPGETDNDFEELLDFCEEVQFDNLGLFKYSPEEGTLAFKLKGRIDETIIEERYLTLLDLQNKISKAKLDRRAGKTELVLIQEVDDGGVAIGRTWFQAPEVDGVTYVDKPDMKPGDMIEVRIKRAGAYDLFSEPLKEE
ncbi:MAG: 30S ribosomal protein S12 methylthiotransferase RimO [Candidatus Zixiibacteriota bacterium]|nr:MAG: 30S ribosomal protein S12 methylthiotransferase RimO [candidate division Zixibacteria bacterium]